MQLALVERTIPLLPIIPADVRRRLAGRRVGSERVPVVSLPPALRRFIRTPERIGVAEFAKRHRVVTDGGHAGRWRHEYAPHTVKIMDTFCDPWVRELWYLGVDQSAKTNTMLNCLAWCVPQSPGNIFFLMPTEAERDKITAGKLKPLFTQSPYLSAYLSDKKDDTSLSRIFFKNGIALFPAHANSAGSMASWSAKHCFGDEVDLYPELVGGKDTDPITQIGKRNRTFKGRYKRFFASTPRGKFIHKGTYACHQVWQWQNRCPHCDQLIVMDASHLALADKANDEQVALSGCDYICNQCSAVITERDRIDAIRGGQWVCIKGADISRPEKVGFHHRAWDCLDVSLREIAVAYLKSQSGSLAAKIAYANGIEAIDYEHVQQDRAEDFILRLVDEQLPRGVVPDWAACLLMTVDTQKIGFFYQVWACGYGPDVRSHLVQHGYVSRFADVVDLAGQAYHTAGGAGYRVLRGYIDSGGGTDQHHKKHSRTAAVYEFCRKNRVFRPVKGNSRQEEIWSPKKIDFYPSRTGKKIPMVGGPILYKLQVNHLKDELSDRLQVDPGAPGSITLHAGTGNDFASQMCAEYADERGAWHCPRGKANHHWDGSVYLRGAIAVEQLATKRQQHSQGQRVIVHSKGAQH